MGLSPACLSCASLPPPQSQSVPLTRPGRANSTHLVSDTCCHWPPPMYVHHSYLQYLTSDNNDIGQADNATSAFLACTSDPRCVVRAMAAGADGAEPHSGAVKIYDG